MKCPISVLTVVFMAAFLDPSGRARCQQRPSTADLPPPAESDPYDASQPAPLPNRVSSTLGGKQFWGDELFFGQWRIQRNTLSGHYRLLDPDDARHAWGTRDGCREQLRRIRFERGLKPTTGPVVITLHGLGRGRGAMNRLVKHLRDNSDYTVLNVSYPSTRASIGDHARALARIIENLDQVTEINFVGHSLGNLVVRHYLADQTDAATGRRPDPRIRRIVMLGPPNHGSRAAATFSDNWAFQAVLGDSALQIARLDKMKDRLAIPTCQFGIIAGGKGNDRGFNPLLAGDDDGTVTVSETRLTGARDFLRVDVLHSFLNNNPSALEATLRFLRHGHFAENGIRQPIEPEESPPSTGTKD